MDEQLQMIDQVSNAAIDLGMKFAPKVFTAVAILVAGYFAGRWAARAASRGLARFHLEPPVRFLLERVTRLFVLALFIIMARSLRAPSFVSLSAACRKASFVSSGIFFRDHS